MKRTLLALLLLAGTLAMLPEDATAWRNRGYFNVHVLGHRFHAVAVRNGSFRDNTQCVLKVKVKFWSPTSYYHRWQAKVVMDNGAWIRTPVFFNMGYGQRIYNYTFDTSYQGCWATRYHAVSHLKVSGCMGQGCYLRPVR